MMKYQKLLSRIILDNKELLQQIANALSQVPLSLPQHQMIGNVLQQFATELEKLDAEKAQPKEGKSKNELTN